MLLGVGDDPFARYLPLEATDRAFDALVIVNLYLCHSKPPFSFTERKAYTTGAASVNLVSQESVVRSPVVINRQDIVDTEK